MSEKNLIGIPFLKEGRDPSVGLDCWGLVMAAMRKYGYEVPDFKISCFASREINGIFLVEASRGWERVENPLPGRVLAMSLDWRAPGAVNHFGVCIGEGRFLHTRVKTASCVERLNHPLWARTIKGVYRWTG